MHSPVRPALVKLWHHMRHFYISTLTLIVCLAVTYGLWVMARQTVEAEGRMRFETRVKEISDAIEIRMFAYVQTLYQTRGFFQIHGIPRSDDFSAYIRSINLTKNYPGIQGLGFSQRVRAEDLRSHIAAMQAAGASTYGIHPQGPRPEYHSIVLLEPFDWRNQRAFGYDMHSDPLRRKAMDLAVTTGLPQVTEIVTLVQETDADRQPGFLVYLPLYSTGETPPSVTERRQHLLGFVYAAFRAHDLFQSVFEMPKPEPGIDFEIFAGEMSRERLLYDRDSQFHGGTTVDGELSRSITLQVSGQSWTLFAHTLPAFQKRIANSVPVYVLAIGLILSVLIYALLLGHSFNVRNEHILLTEAQRELTERRRTETELRNSEERYRVLTETITNGVWTARASGVITYINRWWQRYSGLALGEGMREDWESVVHPDHLESFRDWIQKADPEAPVDLEVPFRHQADGRYRWHLARRLAVRDERGAILQWVTVATDIHQIKELEKQRRSRDEELKIITDALPALISYTDAKGIVRFLNAEYARWFARPLESMLGRSMDELWTTFQAQPHAERIFRSQAFQGQRVSFETQLHHSDGSLRPVTVSYVPRFLPDGGAADGFFALMTDLSDLRRVQHELQMNRERFELVTRSVELGLWYCDLPFDTLIWNAWVKEHFFFPPDAIITIDAFYDRLHKDDRERVRAAIQYSIDEHVPYDIEYRTVHPETGALKWIRAIGLGIYDESGKALRFDGMTLDITGQKAKEERLQQEMRTTETLYKVGRSLAAEFDLPRLLAIITESAREAIGADHGAYASLDEEGLHDALKELIQAFSGEGLLQLADIQNDPRFARGQTLAALLPTEPPLRSFLAAPVTSRGGEIIGALLFGHQEPEAFDRAASDLVTGIAKQAAVAIENAALFRKAEGELQRRRAAEENLKALNEDLEVRVRDRTAQLEAANRELEAFAYSVSHDLRAPLRGIDGFTSILERKYTPLLDAEGRHYLKRVKDAAGRMSQLIDDMLNLTRLTRQDMQRVPLNLSALAQSVARFLSEAEPKRKAEFRIQEGMQVHADPVLMRAVLENLMGNAWKFTSHRSEGALIEVGMTIEDGQPLYFIKDNGAGFDMEYAEKLFRPFQRLHSAHEFPGSGIGLASVQRVIQRHGGKVWAEGRVDEGARFYFTLAASERNPA